MSSFYKCAFFNQSSVQDLNDFSVSQEEIIFNKQNKDKSLSFLKKEVVYKCSCKIQKDFSPERPTLIIPIRDNLKLLKYTFSNLKKNNVNNHANILVVDDRSEEDIRTTTLSEKLSYLRVDNDKGFNFSMLNNIAAKICSDLGSKEIILWNSDLWCVKEDYFIEFVRRHKESESKISGAKLVYPPLDISLNKEKDTKNIKDYFPKFSNGKWREKVQFGGDAWLPQGINRPIILSADHNKRFANIDNPMVDCDRGALFVTGAIQYWDLDFFIKLGGLNPSLSKVFQDVDICLKAVVEEEYPRYFGKDLYFYHDESLTLNNVKNEKKADHQFISDHYLFGKLWNDKIVNIVYGV